MKALADYFLAYPIFSEAGRVIGTGRGKQPYEGLLSAICEAFTCTPEEAERQNWRKVRGILDYRAARDATDIQKGKHQGVILDDYPELKEIMDEMRESRNS